MYSRNNSNRGLNERQTIMMRGDRKYLSPTNMTTAEIQFQKEQRKLDAKRKKRMMLSNSRRIAICGSKHERVQEQREVKKKMDEIVAFKKTQNVNERRSDKSKISEAVSREQAIFDREERKKQEKREYLRKMMEENKRLVQMRKIKDVEVRNKEKEKATKEVEFFDKYKSYL